MPIYANTFREYEGRPRKHFRWLVVIEQELRTLAKFRIFKLLYLIACLHVIIRLLQIVGYDVLAQDPNNPLQLVFSNIAAIEIKATTFFGFLYLQTSIMFIILLYSGAGMICNDVRNNLMEIYFSKPLTWVDYALGKILTLVLLGLSITALPGIFLVLLHNLLLPGLETLQASWWWPLSILAYSLLIVIPTALCVLACSAVLPTQNYATITIIMALVADSSFSGLLATLLRQRNFLAVSFPLTLRRVGEVLFNEHRNLFTLPWYWSFLFVVTVCLLALLILLRRLRREELA
ncbi:MAG: hypothetical protein GX117_06175 [Candidatus Hydrogenedentes bacterium]|nr:hypothetical protein [Candidatus Hydrogenedentota bacterium]